MKKAVWRFLALFILSALAFNCTVPSGNDLRYFDTAEENSGQVRVAILYPSFGSLHSLIKLKERNIFNPDNLIIIGVYHEKERSDYQRSIDMVREKNIDWIKFHKVSAEINKDNLFEKNPLSNDFKLIFKKSAGIIFFGGTDIPPYLYNEQTELLTSIRTPYRHFLELSFVFHLLGGSQNESFKPLLESAPEFPVLGICLGEQTLNVGSGGDMVQDVWAEKYGIDFVEEAIALSQDNWHKNPIARLYPEENLFSYHLHPIKLESEGKFIKEFGFKVEDTPRILSSHHQAVDKLGKGMTVIATSIDGKVIEAIEHKKYPNVLGIQFHPEFPSLYDQDEKHKITPEDQKAISSLSILENNPPSLAFHKKIWSWFSEKLSKH
jgi:putative glutamine amidotransferase